jgi:hypothetical protein
LVIDLFEEFTWDKLSPKISHDLVLSDDSLNMDVKIVADPKEALSFGDVDLNNLLFDE